MFKHHLDESQHLLLEAINKEYEAGFLALNSLPNYTVTFYGGAKIEPKSSTFAQIFELAKLFAQKKWGVISGGGPGVMAAALKGSHAGGGISAGFRISLLDEKPEHEADFDLLFNHFSVRKYMLRQADVFVYAPGGLGTLDELMENLCLIKTKKQAQKPIFLYDSKFWAGYVSWFEEIIVTKGLADKNYLNLFSLVDSPDEVMAKLEI